jgi:hypothetical protein
MVQTPFCGSNPRITGLCATPSVTELLQAPVRDQRHPKVTPTSAKATVTMAASGKIGQQAGMSKGMSDVRSYVGVHEERVYVKADHAATEDWEK